MKKILFLVVLALGLNTSFSQSAKALYFELGGPGLAAFNFDTRFSGREDGLGGRIGFGGFAIEGTGAVFIPVGLNYLVGKDSRNYFELGGGVTPVIAFENFSNNNGAFSTTFGHLNFGYRLQPKDGGFFFRAAINPVFAKGFFWPYYGGVTFGYKFPTGKPK